MIPSPVVELNLAVATAMAEGPAAGLARVEALDATGALRGYHLLAATRADLLRRLGRWAEAAVAYREAIALVGSEVERRYLERRLAEVGDPGELGNPDEPRPVGPDQVQYTCPAAPTARSQHLSPIVSPFPPRASSPA